MNCLQKRLTLIISDSSAVDSIDKARLAVSPSWNALWRRCSSACLRSPASFVSSSLALTTRANLFIDNSFAHALKFPLTECNARAKVSRMASSELTSTQVAERLDVAPATVRLWCSQGKFKHARLVE